MIIMWHNIQNEINSPQGHSSGVLVILIKDGHIMSSLKDNKTCALLQQYLSYLTIVKGRSQLTAEEYRVDNNKYGNVDIRTLQQILGHENLNTTQIYTAVDNDQLQAAVNSNPLASMFGHQFINKSSRVSLLR